MREKGGKWTTDNMAGTARVGKIKGRPLHNVVQGEDNDQDNSVNGNGNK